MADHHLTEEDLDRIAAAIEYPGFVFNEDVLDLLAEVRRARAEDKIRTEALFDPNRLQHVDLEAIRRRIGDGSVTPEDAGRLVAEIERLHAFTSGQVLGPNRPRRGGSS